MNRLKSLRNEHGMSQAEFARKIGVAQNTVSNWENGNRLIDTETIARIADLFDTSVDYLLGRTDDIDQKPDDENITFDDFTYAMYNESKELTDEDKQALLGMARLLKKKKESQNG